MYCSIGMRALIEGMICDSNAVVGAEAKVRY